MIVDDKDSFDHRKMGSNIFPEKLHSFLDIIVKTNGNNLSTKLS
jgi:hypothetical protein